MDKVLEILHFCPQSLTVTERAQALAQCQALVFQSEASQILDTVRDAGAPGFKLKTGAQNRLKTLLDWTGTNERIIDLHRSAPGVFMILGLCLTTRDIVRLKDEMFNEILRQAQLMEPESTRYLVHHPQVLKVVNSSSNSIFKDRFEALRAEYNMTDTYIRLTQVNGVHYYHYYAPTQPKLDHLIRLSFNGIVAVYLPEVEIDGILKITTPWDTRFLEKLFVFDKAVINEAAGFTSSSYLAQIAHCLGQDIFNAMDASLERDMERQAHQNQLTNCVKCQGFPGQVIIVEITVSKAECRNILSFRKHV